MKHKAVKELLRFVLAVFLSVSAVLAVSIFMNGMYLLGDPRSGGRAERCGGVSRSHG